MNVFRGAAGSPPATIVVFGGGLTPPMVNEMSRMSNTPNLCDIRGKDYQEVELVMLGAPVSVNVIHVPDPTGSGAAASTSQVQGLEHLAGITGNRITRLVGIERQRRWRGLRRRPPPTIASRLLPEDSERNGLTHPVSVQGQPAGCGGDDASQRRSFRPPAARSPRAKSRGAARHAPRGRCLSRPSAARGRVHFARGRRPTRPGSSSWWSRWKRRRR